MRNCHLPHYGNETESAKSDIWWNEARDSIKPFPVLRKFLPEAYQNKYYGGPYNFIFSNQCPEDPGLNWIPLILWRPGPKSYQSLNIHLAFEVAHTESGETFCSPQLISIKSALLLVSSWVKQMRSGVPQLLPHTQVLRAGRGKKFLLLYVAECLDGPQVVYLTTWRLARLTEDNEF